MYLCSMHPDQLFELGYLADTHGIKGGLVIVIDADEPQHYSKLKHLFVKKKNSFLPYFIQSIKIQKNGEGIVTFEDVGSDEAADSLVGSTVHAPVSELPPLKDGQFYFHELPGSTIEDEKLGNIGTIIEVFDTEFQSIVSFQHQGQEVMFPLHEDLYDRFDRPTKTLFTRLPDGLLEAYIKEDEGSNEN